jgi:hypothetical protein
MSQPDVVGEPHPGELPAPAPKRRRRLLGCGVALLVLFGACGGLYGLLTYTGNKELREAEAEADRLDPEGWRLNQIEARRKVLADEENAALVVLSAKSKLPAGWPKPRPAPVLPGVDAAAPSVPSAQRTYVDGDLDQLPPEVQLDGALLRDLRDSLKAADENQAVAEASKLAALRDGRYPLTWSKDIISTLIPSQDARMAANLLRLRAALLAQEGRADEALEATRGVLVAARSVGDEPFMISQLIRMSCAMMAGQALERVLAQGEPSPAELQKMQELLEAEAAEPVLVYAARGERASMNELMKVLKSREVSPSVIGGSQGFRAGFDLVGPTLAQTSHGRILRMMTEEVEIAKLPPEQQAEPAQALEKKVKEAKARYDVIVGLLMPTFQKISESYRREQAYLRCAVVAVAAERYRRDHGGWPAALGELAPRYIEKLPNDPYDGQPLRYKRLADGVVVYSVGADKKDDGGARNRANPRAEGTDCPFRLWNPDKRRQPAAELLPPPVEGWGQPGDPEP